MNSYLWRANFKGNIIEQPADDRYSKYDPNAEWNPSSFRDFLDYFDGHEKDLISFELCGPKCRYVVYANPDNKKPYIYRDTYLKRDSEVLYESPEELKDVRIIYFRSMESTAINGEFGEPIVKAYNLGFQGIDKDGNNCQKTIVIVL